jgi:hypothetical protein
MGYACSWHGGIQYMRMVSTGILPKERIGGKSGGSELDRGSIRLGRLENGNHIQIPYHTQYSSRTS